MNNLTISTCGTSLLTNTPGPASAVLRETASFRRADLTTAQRDTLDAHIAACQTRLEAAEPVTAATLSAELRALWMIGDLGTAWRSHHVLITNDTYQGQRCAELIEAWLARRVSVERLSVPGLAPVRYHDFRIALGELAKTCLDLVEYHRGEGRKIVFNLNGGFKAVQGFMQTLGCHCADECVYVFETGRELMRIPRLPMVLDSDGVVGRFLTEFRVMAAGRALPKDDVAAVPETLLFELDGMAVLSEWGQIVWRGCRDRYYGTGLLPAPDPAIVFANRFERGAERLPPDRLVELNRQVDSLVICLASNQSRNPRSLSLHRLQGDPVKGSTHEFYAWSDRDAARVFGHFEAEGGRFVIDQIGSHL